jgi:hypothetical protein
MRSARLPSLLVLAGLIAAGLVLEVADDGRGGTRDLSTAEAGVGIPSARPEPTLASTWYCAAGTAAAEPDGRADHVLILANPTDRARRATVTVLSGRIAPAPAPETPPTTAVAGAETTSTTAPSTTTTEAPPSTTTTPLPGPVAREVELPAQSRVEVRVGDIAASELGGAIVEVDGGEISVEHQISGGLGVAIAPCSTSASPTWSFPWGVTSRGSRELLVFMNPFPDDATVDIAFATDEGVRDTARFQGFVVPGRSVVGAYIDQDITRKGQVSAQVRVRGGRLVVDRIQSFDGTDGRHGLTLALGVPEPGPAWAFPVGETGPGLTEQVVVFNPGDHVAEVEVDVHLDDPGAAPPPEPFSLTIPPRRYSIIDVQAEERVPQGVGHALVVRSVNGVPITAERVNTAADPASRRGVGVTSGSPIAAPVWYFPGGGPVKEERDEYLVLLNLGDDPVTYSVGGFSAGQTLAIQGLQDQTIAPGARAVIRLGDHLDRADLAVMVTADGPIVAERDLYRVDGLGMSMSIGIPLAEGLVPAG